MYRGSWLWVTQIVERLAKDNSILAIVEEGAQFGLSRGRHDEA
jgi:hypothetical protein